VAPALARRSVARVLALESPATRLLAHAAMALAVCVGLLAGSAAQGAGPVVGWGAGAAPISAASALELGDRHQCAIQAGTAAVVCWGDNSNGQATPPASVNGIAGTASAIAAGLVHSCAIQAGTDTVVCWGNDSNGQARPPPSVDGTAGGATAIAAGEYHTLALPEPEQVTMLLAGCLLLGVLAKQRVARTRGLTSN